MWPASTGNVSIAMIISSPQTWVISSQTPTVSPKSGPESTLYSSVLGLTFKPIETSCSINLAPSLLPLHLRQGSVAGTQSVVLVGNGRTKQGHAAIAQHLVHRAFNPVHGVHHALQGWIAVSLPASALSGAPYAEPWTDTSISQSFMPAHRVLTPAAPLYVTPRPYPTHARYPQLCVYAQTGAPRYAPHALPVAASLPPVAAPGRGGSHGAGHACAVQSI